MNNRVIELIMKYYSFKILDFVESVKPLQCLQKKLFIMRISKTYLKSVNIAELGEHIVSKMSKKKCPISCADSDSGD